MVQAGLDKTFEYFYIHEHKAMWQKSPGPNFKGKQKVSRQYGHLLQAISHLITFKQFFPSKYICDQI